MPSKIPFSKQKNLFLCLDAFGTLFTPSIPIPVAYARAAARHGIHVGNTENPKDVQSHFREQFKSESHRNPNYGRATGMGAERWWGNVIHNTFIPFLRQGQQFPKALTKELLQTYSSSEGYTMYRDVRPFFDMLRSHNQSQPQPNSPWPWHKTVVGIITNSDARVPDILSSFGLSIGPRRVGTADQRERNASLEDDITFVVLSYDVGVEKPDRKMFDAAVDILEDMLVGNEEGLMMGSFEKLYVGDDLEKDYDGAAAAGWDRILLQRDLGREGEDGEMSSFLGSAEVENKDGKKRVVDVVRSLFALSTFRSQHAGEMSTDVKSSPT